MAGGQEPVLRLARSAASAIASADLSFAHSTKMFPILESRPGSSTGRIFAAFNSIISSVRRAWRSSDFAMDTSMKLRRVLLILLMVSLPSETRDRAVFTPVGSITSSPQILKCSRRVRPNFCAVDLLFLDILLLYRVLGYFCSF